MGRVCHACVLECVISLCFLFGTNQGQIDPSLKFTFNYIKAKSNFKREFNSQVLRATQQQSYHLFEE